jgi:hypothetical protein
MCFMEETKQHVTQLADRASHQHAADEVEALMARAFPDSSPDERTAIRLDLEALSHVLRSIVMRKRQEQQAALSSKEKSR